jgi:hypothetical protein
MKKGGKVMAIIGISLGGVSILLFIVWLVIGIIALTAGGIGGNMGNFKF